MDDQTKKLLARAEQLKQSIADQTLEMESLYDQATAATYWLRPGNVIVMKERQRRCLIEKIHTNHYYYIVWKIASYAKNRFKPNNATVWVWPIKQDGTVEHCNNQCLQHYQNNNITRLDHLDDYENVDSVDLSKYETEGV